ncbi:CBS domain-containing protein [Campylobacter peloridis]|uniref:CBS domain-containing protein n=1 Tax=Campylobacter peloridis TaxID=488546 RepID=A0A5C7DXM0_9BACT|nr:nucleotidyltransferase family protein [Campylobacter peloridis]TXE81322.1 CBS domain-containing protein [Campylobacter peloridis]
MNINDLKLKENSTIKQALSIIGSLRVRLGVIVDKNDNFLGIISDSNIRKALINGYTINDSIKNIYTKNPITIKKNTSKKELLKLASLNDIYDFPILDKNNKIIAIKSISSIFSKNENIVVLMAGGLGTRLGNLTKNTPKPMLKVGNKPILENIIQKLSDQNFENFIFCVNYKKQIIKKYFKNGEKFGINIKYIEEEKPLGTAGALSLIKEKITKSFIIMNGDILTDLDFNELLKAHKKSKAIMSVCVREFTYQIPYGVIKTNKNFINDIQEKPEQKFLVSAGIYVCEPCILDLLKENEYLNMPELIKLVMQKAKVNTFLLNDYWIDIGLIEQYKKANEEFR